jgi:two-component system response regulator BaeR
MIQKIAVVEDEPKLAKTLVMYLEAAGYQCCVITDGAKAYEEILAYAPHIVLLDLNLPNVDGVEVCRLLRENSHIPVIMTTARVDEIDRLKGLNVGADDYVCKPYSVKEVVARVQALLRRTTLYNSDSTHTKISTPTNSAHVVQIHIATLSMHYAGQHMTLTKIECLLMQMLIAHEQSIFSRVQIMDAIYSDYRIVNDRTIDSHIKKLRAKLAQVWPATEFIHSAYGMGYYFKRVVSV